MNFVTNLWANNRPLAMLIAGVIIVIPFLIFYLRKALSEHPKGLIPAALSNMGERFGYYIMNAVLSLFICSKFGVPDTTAGIMFGVFYFLIYVLSLPGGIIADRTQNYKKTIIWGIIVMAMGYCILSVPVFSGHGFSWVMVLTIFALILIACGNGLFKGNLQAIVGQIYDDFEAEAAKKGPEELEKAKAKRDTGFQIFYVFINIGGVIAPFIAPIIRNWWLGLNGLTYNAQLPKLCHNYVTNNMTAGDMENLTTLTAAYPDAANNLNAFCENYVTVFNTGVHYAFIASVVAMLISLTIFLCTKKGMPNPAKKEAAAANGASEQVVLSAEEKAAMAKDVKQRMMGLYAVLGVCVFFWMSFHQNAESLSFFARDFVNSDAIPVEIWQCINPFFVIILTPFVMWLFASLSKKNKEVSTPKKIAFGMGIAACAYLFLMILCMNIGYPKPSEFLGMSVEQSGAMKVGPWAMIVVYFFLTVAELFISPLGLSFVSKIAPKHIQGICQGLWLSATAIGNLLIMLGPIFYNNLPKLWMCWLVFLVICIIAMSIMFGMLKWLEKITAE